MRPTGEEMHVLLEKYSRLLDVWQACHSNNNEDGDSTSTSSSTDVLPKRTMCHFNHQVIVVLELGDGTSSNGCSLELDKRRAVQPRQRDS